MACAIQAPVIAPTDWAQAVAHENITLQDGSVWQIGQCHIAPHPIPVPNKPTPPPTHALHFMMETGECQVVPVERVQALDFRRSGFLNAPELHLDDQDAQKLLGTMKFEEPKLLQGEPLALPTGELSIRYTDSEGEEHERRFELLAEHLLRDLSVPGVVYPVDNALRAALPKYNLRKRG